MDWLAKVIGFGFQDAVGQNFGWLKEDAKQKKKSVFLEAIWNFLLRYRLERS